MKKAILFLFLFLSFFVTKSVFAEAVSRFEVDYRINQDGTVAVKEQITYDFGANAVDRHGIYREIPYLKKNQKGELLKMDIADFQVSHPYTLSRENNRHILKIGDPDRTVSGEQTYQIQYLVKGGLSYFSDHDEFYWNVNGTDWNIDINAVSATVHLPKVIGPEKVSYQCYTGSLGSTQEACEINNNGRMITYRAKQFLPSGSNLTIVAGFPKGLVATLEPVPYTPFWQSQFGKLLALVLKIGLLFAITFWYLVYPVVIIVKWFKYGQDPKPAIGETSAWFSPPKINKQELTPAETGTLIDEKVQFRDIFATIIDLARRGYLKIEEHKKQDFYFVKTKPFANDKTLFEYETKLLTDIFSESAKVRIKTKKMFTTFAAVSNKLYQRTVDLGLFEKNPNSIRIFYGVMAALGLMSLNLFLAVVALIFGMNMPRKTKLGSELAAVSRSLKNFLASQDRQLKFQADKQLLFERLLPFAIAYGVEKVWAKRFSNFDLKSPDWYKGQTTNNFTSALLVNHLNQSFSSVQSSMVTSTTSSSGFSSGSSGGSSGGGGGGGGGGSW